MTGAKSNPRPWWLDGQTVRDANGAVVVSAFNPCDMAALADILRDMRVRERELWAGKPPRMGNGAIALMLDGFISRLEVSTGEAPPPKS